jgi:hypothetical protein
VSQANFRIATLAGCRFGRRRSSGYAREKVEHLLGMSLDQMHDILSWRAAELDPYRLSAQWQVARVVLMIGTKYVLDADRDRQRSRALEELARRFNGQQI